MGRDLAVLGALETVRDSAVPSVTGVGVVPFGLGANTRFIFDEDGTVVRGCGHWVQVYCSNSDISLWEILKV